MVRKRGMTKIKNLALCGGGFYGYAEVGALMELENYSEYLDIKEISGVSVGSIVATLYAVGYTASELNKIMFDFDFDSLIRDSLLPYVKFYTTFGMYMATALELEVEKLICDKTHIKNCTFSQLEKNLTIISTNLNYQCPTLFNKESTPTMVISKAVRMSIGYPVVIAPVQYEGDLYGDGGEFINYPITIFENLSETIGITFAAHNENPNGTLKSRIEINNIYDYLRSLAVTMSRAAYVSQITPNHLNRSIVIQITEKIDSMQFNLNSDQKHFLFRCGVNSVREQIDKILGISIVSDLNSTLNEISQSVPDFDHDFKIIK